MSSCSRHHDRTISLEVVVDREVLRISLRGEADMPSTRHLQALLDGIQPDGARLARLDVSALGFVDVAALRQLTLFVRRLRQSSLPVETRGARPPLLELARHVGIEDELGIR